MLKRILLFIPVLLLSACLEESSDKVDKKAFTKIYDNSEFYSSFYAIDMKQTPDGGYLILGGKTKIAKNPADPDELNVNTPMSVYLLKVDALGAIVNERELAADYVYPIGKLNQIGDSFYFFCMDGATNAFLVNVDQLGESTAEPVAIVTDGGESIALPLASNVDNSEEGGLLLLSYDNESLESLVSRVSTSGEIPATDPIRFYTGDESPIEDLVIKHALREGTQFPFTVGQTADTYFFNGFINYTFSLVFSDLSENEKVDGIVNGHQQNAGFSTVLPISGQTFAVSTYNFGFNFLLPNATLVTNGPPTDVTVVQADGFAFPELESNARVKAIRGVLKGKNVIIYGSNTKSGQIGLYIYDEATGEFLSSKYLGYSNPFEIAAVVQTADGDLVISGTTYIAGRLPRFCLIKVPKDEIKD